MRFFGFSLIKERHQGGITVGKWDKTNLTWFTNKKHEGARGFKMKLMKQFTSLILSPSVY